MHRKTNQNGTVDWGRLGVDAAVGGLSGGLRAGTGGIIAAKSGESLAAPAAGAELVPISLVLLR